MPNQINDKNRTNINWVKNLLPKTDNHNLQIMSEKNVLQVKLFHESFPQYSQTPLVRLSNLASYLNVKDIFVKDESYRFGLNSFKVLGSSYAMAKYISKISEIDMSEMTYQKLTSDEIRNKIGELTFYTATDGNHGRGVAWAARELKQKAIVYMPKGTVQSRLNHILKLGAQASIEDVYYDECVELAKQQASDHPNSVLMQDTAWQGYTEIPKYIMQGYGTMTIEAYSQIQKLGCNRPTHIFIQAGVGTLAGAVIGYFSNMYKDNPPVMVVVEPNGAACFYKSALASDGKPHGVEGKLETIMAGLCCGVPNTTSWDIISNCADCFISCEDNVSARGMRILGAPLKSDQRIISGESGAVCVGVLSTILQNPQYNCLKELLELDSNSQILLFSTEGDTDPIRYRDIVWDGDYCSQ